jgi:L-lactate dehydrogenase complex protein LldG
MTDNRTEFVQTVRRALDLDPASARKRYTRLFPSGLSDEAKEVLQKLQSRTEEDRQSLLERLMEQAVPLNLKVAPVENLPGAARYIADLVRDRSPEWGENKSVIRWAHPLVDALDLESALADQQVPVHTTAIFPDADLLKQKQAIRAHNIASFVGVTAADFCLADTATIVMKTRPDQGRAVSLVPAVHVAVLTLDQMLESLTELYAILEQDRIAHKNGLTHHMVFISGPSKTADIELTMVHGAHGPKEMHLVVVRKAAF